MRVTIDITDWEINRVHENLDWCKSGQMPHDKELIKKTREWYEKIIKAYYEPHPRTEML